MKITKEEYKRFYIGMAIPLLVFLCYFALASQFLKRAGEYSPMPDITAKLAETGGLYGPGLYETTFWYKKAVYDRIRPDVVAVGSSRVLQFLPSDFTVPFTNAGSLRSLEEAAEMVDTLFTIKKPKVLILGIDFWWYRDHAVEQKYTRSPENPELRLVDLFEPARWLVRGKVGFGDVVDVMTGNTPHLGIAAIARQDGFDAAGAYYYSSLVTGAEKNYDLKFVTTLDRIEKGDHLFTHDDPFSEEQYKKTEELFRKIKTSGVHTIVFITPLAPAAIDAIEKNKVHYAYIPQVQKRIPELARKYGLPVFDFHDIRNLGSGDCEFLDGIHGGETAYGRVLKSMSAADPVLSRYVDHAAVEAKIRRNAGHATGRTDEVDFLDWNCKKNPER